MGDIPTWTTADATSEKQFHKWVQEQAQVYPSQWVSQGGISSAGKVPAKLKDPIETATDDVLILELIKRGFAVGKLDGQASD